MLVEHMIVDMFGPGLRVLGSGLFPGCGADNPQIMSAHHRADSGLRDLDTLVLEHPGDLARTYHTVGILMHGFDRRYQLLLADLLLGQWLGLVPPIIRGPRDAQHSTHHGNQISGLLGFDEFVTV